MFSSSSPHRRANLIDRVATFVITSGGIAIIAAVILILVLIFEVAFPLLKPPSAREVANLQVPAAPGGAEIVALCVDEYLETAGLLDRSGLFRFITVADGKLASEERIAAPGDPAATILSAELYGNLQYSVHWSNHEVTLVKVGITTDHSGAGARTIVASVSEEAQFKASEGMVPIYSVGRLGEEGAQVRVDQTGPSSLLVSQLKVAEDFLGNKTETAESTPLTVEGTEIRCIVLDGHGSGLYAGTANGRILRWSIGEPGEVKLTDDVAFDGSGKAITNLAMVFGDVSVAAVNEAGDYSTWFPVENVAEATRPLTRIHDLKSMKSGTQALFQSRRNKMMLRVLDDGTMNLDYPTNERHLLSVRAEAPLTQVSLNTRANGIAGLDSTGKLALWELDAPHPEISLGTLFGKIWYEKYPKPESTWQSSASSDDFEPKFSLVPLIFGSFKGTVYAMFFAVPLALLGAIYTSQFTSRAMQGIIKSTLEIMAAVPSVVIGFLVALWLAPIVETNVLSFMCSVGLFPVCYILFLLACQPFRETAFFKRLERGNEFLVMIPVTLLSGVLAWKLGGFVESALFSGDFKAWLYTQGETRYDQRNCIIIAFGLGFAVIPIIFTIAEDALSNIPGSLKAASQALGASRWQTVWRVILPTASPGIFAGIIIGFGRAVGETMIVLMATGNTPILDWSPFNGMRTLSANIAVEIPEAPVGGTLYRVLFLSAVLLLLLTSILNTMAELIRQHLRNKYGLSQ